MEAMRSALPVRHSAMSSTRRLLIYRGVVLAFVGVSCETARYAGQ